MLSVTYQPFMPSVIMLNVVTLSVMAPALSVEEKPNEETFLSIFLHLKFSELHKIYVIT
jgi:hypothetical protein